MAKVLPKAEPIAGNPEATLPEGVEEELRAANEKAAAHEANQLVAVKIGGREFKVAPELADAYSEREKEFSRGITMDRQSAQELQQLRDWRTQVMQPNGRQDQGPYNGEFQTKFFTAPHEAARMIEDNTLRRAEQLYELREGDRRFWDGFFRQNPDYVDAEPLARYLAQNHFQELMTMPTVSQRQERLAELTGKEILRITRKVKTDDDKPRPRPVERASGERVPEPSREEQEEANLPKSLGDALRQNAKARARAREAKRSV